MYKYYSVLAIDLAISFNNLNRDGAMTKNIFYSLKNIFMNLPASEQTRFYSDTSITNTEVITARNAYKELETIYTDVVDNSKSNYPIYSQSSQNITRVLTTDIKNDELYLIGIQKNGSTYFLKENETSSSSTKIIGSISNSIKHTDFAANNVSLNEYAFYINKDMKYIVNGYSHKFMNYQFDSENNNYKLAWSNNPISLDSLEMSENGKSFRIIYGGSSLGLIDSSISYTYNKIDNTDTDFDFVVYKFYSHSAIDLANYIVSNEVITKQQFMDQYNSLAPSERERFRIQGEIKDVYDYDESTLNSTISRAFNQMGENYTSEFNSMLIGWTIDYSSGNIVNVNFGDDITITVQKNNVETSIYYNDDLYSDERGKYYVFNNEIYMYDYLYGATLYLDFVNWDSQYNGISIQTKEKGFVDESLSITYEEISGEYLYITPKDGIEYMLFLDQETQDDYIVLYKEISDSYFSGLNNLTTYYVSYRSKETSEKSPSNWVGVGKVTTKTKNPNKPDSVSFEEIGDTFIIINAQTGVEYSIGENYSSTGEFNGLKEGGTYTVYARYSANSEYGPGDFIETSITLFTSLEYWKNKCDNKLDELLPKNISIYKKTLNTSNAISAEISNSNNVDELKGLFVEMAGYIAFSLKIDDEISNVSKNFQNSNAFFVDDAINSSITELMAIDYTNSANDLSLVVSSSNENIAFNKKKQSILKEYCSIFNEYLNHINKDNYDQAFSVFSDGYKAILVSTNDDELIVAYKKATGGF